MAPFARTARLITPIACLLALLAPLLLSGCDEKIDSNTVKAKIGGQTFLLEIAADDDKRFIGLGKREKDLEDDGGMIFLFSTAEVRSFVMRDCKFDIDIIYLDGAGRVLSTHHMVKEEPRGPDETADADGFNKKYDDRLKRYSSRFPAQFVIEIKGGKLQSLSLKEGDRIDLRWDELKRLAR